MAYINIKDVSFEYPGGYLAVDNINFEIERGENIAIIGQNGAGKTTTVKLFNKLLTPTKGDVIIGDMNTKDYTTAQVSRKVGYVFQNPDDQIFHSSVYGEVSFGPRKAGLSEKEIEEKVAYALSITNLTKERDENPYNLPLSVRKFVTIAAIIAMDTDVMIFDEPTAGQDLYGNLCLAEILKILKEKNKTIITISHDMEFVANNFDRVIVMANRKVVTSGKAEDIFWDFDALEKAMVKQPYVSALCKKLGIKGNVINMDDCVKSIMAVVK